MPLPTPCSCSPAIIALTVAEAHEARQWANGHPCHLQAAGQAMYEAKAGIHTAASMHGRFMELRNTNCFVDHAMQLPPQPIKRFVRLQRALHAVFIGVPLRLGRLAQKIGLKLDDIASWFIGMAIVIVGHPRGVKSGQHAGCYQLDQACSGDSIMRNLLLGGLLLPLKLYFQPYKFRAEVAALAPDLPENYNLSQALEKWRDAKFRHALGRLSGASS